MARKYSKEERQEALKLAEEIGAAAAARRLGINEDTLYGWRGRQKKRQTKLEQAIGGRSEADLLEENAKLRFSYCRHSRMWRFCRRRWVFSPSAGDSSKTRKVSLHPGTYRALACSGDVPCAPGKPARLLLFSPASRQT